MEVLTALGDAENDLYSANFADYSGGGGTKVSRVQVYDFASEDETPRFFYFRHAECVKPLQSGGALLEWHYHDRGGCRM